MITILEADQSLSLKIGDPVNENGDGKQSLFDFEDRLRYLRRGYARLLRNLRILMREFAPTFANSREVIEQEIDDDTQKSGVGIELKRDTTVITVEKIDELFVTTTATSTEASPIQATYISPDKYLSVKNQGNDMYDTTKGIFYTILSNKIYLLPILTITTKFYSKVDAMILEDAITFDKDDTLSIPNDYVDLFITMAASEAMQDIARSDKVSLYANDINNQLSMLKAYADLKQQLKGSDTDG